MGTNVIVKSMRCSSRFRVQGLGSSLRVPQEEGSGSFQLARDCGALVRKCLNYQEAGFKIRRPRPLLPQEGRIWG